MKGDAELTQDARRLVERLSLGETCDEFLNAVTVDEQATIGAIIAMALIDTCDWEADE